MAVAKSAWWSTRPTISCSAGGRRMASASCLPATAGGVSMPARFRVADGKPIGAPSWSDPTLDMVSSRSASLAMGPSTTDCQSARTRILSLPRWTHRQARCQHPQSRSRTGSRATMRGQRGRRDGRYLSFQSNHQGRGAVLRTLSLESGEDANVPLFRFFVFRKQLKGCGEKLDWNRFREPTSLQYAERSRRR